MCGLEGPTAKDGVPLAKNPSHATLVVSGYLDPATPPVHAEAAAKTLPKARQVVVRNGSHSFAGMTGCIDLLIASFLENPANPLDASCADKIKRPPFVRPD
jgi:pimeloyl-ACP methyl ester carboxylesterase